MLQTYIVTLSCKDRRGIAAAVTSALFDCGGNIQDAQQFNDIETGNFLMRILFELEDGELAELQRRLSGIAQRFEMDLRVRAQRERKRVLLLVSQWDHCLGDLLYRQSIGELDMDVVGVVGNHPLSEVMRPLMGGTPFHHFPITKETKTQQEAQIKAVVRETKPDLVVLARYMQILSDDLTAFLSGRCINIHHSFLPGFKGAKPYHQAHQRGVKLIGATAHFVTADLDEGPIIEQDVERIRHSDLPEDLVRKGRDIERRVLARAVRWFLDDRVLLTGSKAVIFGG